MSPFFLSGSTSFSTKSSSSKNKKDCPYNILGVPKNSSTEEVKRAFLKRALECHPDVVVAADTKTKDDDNEKEGSATIEKNNMHDEFVRIRNAFESIQTNKTSSSSSDDATQKMSDEEFESWFQSQTGYVSPTCISVNMCPSMVKEMAEVADTMEQGGLDRGGYWGLARSLRDGSISGGSDENDETIFRVGSGGATSSGSSGGKTGRRRRKR